MHQTETAAISSKEQDQTVACTGDNPVTTFVANNFWQEISATNGERPINDPQKREAGGT